MKKILNSLTLAAGLAATTLPALGRDYDNDNDDSPLSGAVYTMDNAPGTNHVWAFHRAADGSLSSPTAVASGGAGTGGGLGNQGSVLLSRNGQWLVVCNAGGNSLSLFAASASGLTLVQTVSSQGLNPISLTLHGDLLYVLNAGGAVGGADSIAGFVLAYGHLFPLPGATSSLSASNTGPAQVAFTADGDTLVVTEKATGLLDTFTVGDDGKATLAKSYSSPAPPPFGFASGRDNRIYVSQAAGGGGNPGASSVSSYQVYDDGTLNVISGSVATHQTAACWVALSRDERFAFTANTPNDSISSFWVGRNGSLQLLKSQAGLPGNGSHPADLGVSRDNRYLYTLNGNGSISGFKLGAWDGSLQPLATATGLPTTINGMAVR